MPRTKNMLTRRSAIMGAASLVGGTIAATQLPTLMSRVAYAQDAGAPPVFFDQDQFALIECIVDVMIPGTETPGARAAGVHYFIDLMLDEWAAPARQSRFRDGVRALGESLGDDYLDSAANEQINRLRSVDEAAFSDGAENDFFREFKRLALFGYYSSEPGATIELQHEWLTPEYKACAPIEDIGRAWFWSNFRHGL